MKKNTKFNKTERLEKLRNALNAGEYLNRYRVAADMGCSPSTTFKDFEAMAHTWPDHVHADLHFMTIARFPTAGALPDIAILPMTFEAPTPAEEPEEPERPKTIDLGHPLLDQLLDVIVNHENMLLEQGHRAGYVQGQEEAYQRGFYHGIESSKEEEAEFADDGTPAPKQGKMTF